MSTPIELYVYDLSNGMAKSFGRALTGTDIEGIWSVFMAERNSGAPDVERMSQK